MKRLMLRAWLLVVCAAITAALVATTVSAAGYKLVGVDFVSNSSGILSTSSLYDVDTLTGLASNARDTGVTGLVGIAAQPGTGQLFSLTGLASSPWTNSLLTLDVATGSPTLIGATTLTSIFEGDLAFQPSTGTLYGAPNMPVLGTSNLFTINPTTGVATTVGPITGPTPADYSALAFNAAGTLYAIDEHAGGLLTINPLTGAALSSIPLSVQLGSAVGMAFDPVTGVAYVADGPGSLTGTNSLYTLNTSTGALTLVGSLGLPHGLSGLAFVPVPEPATIALATMGGLALCVFGGRRFSRLS